jgi:hypothetical protein
MLFLIRVALVLLALYLLWRACGRVLRSLGTMSENRESEPPAGQVCPVDELVQDPLCKLYLPRREAIVLKGRDRPLYFCSEKCRDLYVQQDGQQSG